ncbi:hypothetical protein [Mycolicibacter kumamotonensis]|uniref:hypothetical protein n=1 Tax=Mycolicibacter kumamotonensis TaxID=354243 RepID=UPI001056DB67|nr:hypothetical protein [Mycolicibacter kumamotonensis]
MTTPSELLFDPPDSFTLPLSKGGDIHCVFVYQPQVLDSSGTPVLDEDGKATFAVADYPPGCTVRLELDAPDAPVVVVADVAGSEATVLEDHLPVDQLAKPVLWRLVLTDANGVDDVLLNGVTARYDGKPPR